MEEKEEQARQVPTADFVLLLLLLGWLLVLAFLGGGAWSPSFPRPPEPDFARPLSVAGAGQSAIPLRLQQQELDKLLHSERQAAMQCDAACLPFRFPFPSLVTQNRRSAGASSDSAKTRDGMGKTEPLGPVVCTCAQVSWPQQQQAKDHPSTQASMLPIHPSSVWWCGVCEVPAVGRLAFA